MRDAEGHRKKWDRGPSLAVEENDPDPLLTSISSLFAEARDDGLLPIDRVGNMDGVDVDYNPTPDLLWRVRLMPDHNYFKPVGIILESIGFVVKTEKYPMGKPVTLVLEKGGERKPTSGLWTANTNT